MVAGLARPPRDTFEGEEDTVAKVRKVYLPKWMSWFSIVLIVPMWLWVTYSVFTRGEARSDLGLLGWVVMSVVLLGVGLMLFLMGQRKLPAYVIEEEDEGDGGAPGG